MYIYINSLHVYTMITSNHDSGTCISIACTFIPWLFLIMIQVHVYLLLGRLYHDYFLSWFRYIYSLHAYTMITSNHDSGICIYSLHVYTMITSNHDSGTCISIACTFIPWILLIMIQVHAYQVLHVYTMITFNHDSGTCISMTYTFIPWLLPIMIQVHVYIACTFIPWLLLIMIQVHVYL